MSETDYKALVERLHIDPTPQEHAAWHAVLFGYGSKDAQIATARLLGRALATRSEAAAAITALAAERDAIAAKLDKTQEDRLDDLRRLLEALDLGTHARTVPPSHVFEQCLNEIAQIKKEMRAMAAELNEHGASARRGRASCSSTWTACSTPHGGGPRPRAEPDGRKK